MPNSEVYVDLAARFAMATVGVILAVAIGVWVLRIALKQFAETLSKKPYSEQTARATILVIQAVGWLVIALIALRIAGVNVAIGAGPFSIVGWVLILSAALGWNVGVNFVAGLILVNTQPYQIGDDLEILEPTGAQGPLGRVSGFTYLYTTLQQIDPTHGRAVDVQVPNSQFFTRSYRREPATQPSPLRAGK